tara:strand:- start:456 stop:806 length:351 start_codon:yes stop_codon:yes gene_type:complete
MKHMLIIILIILTFSTPLNISAKAGQPIPQPKILIIEAIEITKEHFYNEETQLLDGDYFKIADYILISAQYTNCFNEKYQEEWAWKIKFVHPIQNDHSVVYKVTNNKEIIFLYGSE